MPTPDDTATEPEEAFSNEDLANAFVFNICDAIDAFNLARGDGSVAEEQRTFEHLIATRNSFIVPPKQTSNVELRKLLSDIRSRLDGLPRNHEEDIAWIFTAIDKVQGS